GVSPDRFQSSETAALEIDHGLADFVLRVHDEGTAHYHRLVDRLAGQDQHRGITIGLDGHLAAIAVKQRELRLAGNLAAANQYGALQHHHRNGVTLRRVERRNTVAIELHV